MYKIFIVTAFSLFALHSTVTLSRADESQTKRGAIWVEGGATPNKANSASTALGIRVGTLGFKFGWGGPKDYRSSQVYDAYPLDPSVLGISSKEVGKRTIDESYGFDTMGFYDVCRAVSVYGEVGAYWQEKRDIRVVTGMSQAVRGWQVGTMFNTEPKHQIFSPAAGAGIQYRFFDHPGIALLLTAGYHTIRGVSAGIGFAY